MRESGARLVAVNVVYEIRRGPTRDTAIDKRPVAGAVEVDELGLSGDTQRDRRHHGGPDRALYAYASEDAAWWADQLERDVPPGLFGENLTTEGVDITNARARDLLTAEIDLADDVRRSARRKVSRGR